jgi:hypothetical protein
MIKRVQQETLPAEPVGIVISRGDRTEPAPRFVAFVWGPAPDDEVEMGTATTKAA